MIHYSDTRSEHPHNERFLSDCERWFGRSVTRLHPARYHDVWDVWEKRRMLAFGARDFAPCTDEAGTSVGASACAQLIARTVYLDVPVDIESEAMSVSI